MRQILAEVRSQGAIVPTAKRLRNSAQGCRAFAATLGDGHRRSQPQRGCARFPALYPRCRLPVLIAPRARGRNPLGGSAPFDQPDQIFFQSVYRFKSQNELWPTKISSTRASAASNALLRGSPRKITRISTLNVESVFSLLLPLRRRTLGLQNLRKLGPNKLSGGIER